MVPVCRSIHPLITSAFPSPYHDGSRLNLGERCEVISGTAALHYTACMLLYVMSPVLKEQE